MLGFVIVVVMCVWYSFPLHSIEGLYSCIFTICYHATENNNIVYDVLDMLRHHLVVKPSFNNRVYKN